MMAAAVFTGGVRLPFARLGSNENRKYQSTKLRQS
jgi:hypothetical protein